MHKQPKEQEGKPKGISRRKFIISGGKAILGCLAFSSMPILSSSCSLSASEINPSEKEKEILKMIASKLNDLSYRSDSGEVRNAFKEREISWNVVEKTLVSNKILLPRQVPRKEITVQQKGRKKIATDKIMQDSSSSNASKVPISPDKPKNEFDVACGVVRAGLEVKLHVLSGIRNTTPKLQDEYEKAEAKYSKLSEEEKKEEKLRLIRVQELLITTIDVFSDYRAEGQSILNKINGSPKQSKNLGPIPQDMANGSTFQDSLK